MDQSATQRKLYDKAQIGDMVKAVVDGYHATIFAYGQTGSGKTYTMEGYKYKHNEKGIPIPIIEQSDSEGVVPRSIYQLFELIKQQTSLQKKKYTVHCSYLQIYKEKIYDLLNKSQVKKLTNDGPGLKLRWNKYDQFTVENLYTFECRNADDIMALYHFGIRNKVVASHNMNNQSSRSHTVLSLTVEQIDAKSPDNIITSKFQLVDLAGSERQAFTGTVANKESIDINKSLFTLRQVITALTDKKNQTLPNHYIPYRESKLTSLLRQSLGGNSFCLMIACLNPCDLYIEENISTLQYASKASFISNKPVKNDDPKMRLIEELKKENLTLTEQLAKANETILFLSQITGMNPKTIQANLKNVSIPNQIAHPKELTQINQIVLGETPNGSNASIEQQQLQQRQGSASSAITEKRGESDRRSIITDRILKDKEQIEKFFKEKSETLQNIAVINQPGSFGGLQGAGLLSAVGETKDLITERIVHTVNMMKEVLQSNLNLRETIQKQSETIDNLNTEIFQMQNENEDLRDRVQILEDYTGKDTYSDLTKLVKEKKVLENRVKHLEQTSMNWAQFQATRTQFHQSKDKIVNQSQNGLAKATLDNEFNDDYEPVRCAINTNNNDASLHVLSDLSKFNNGALNRKKKKVQQINFSKQLNRGVKGSQGYNQMQSSIGIDNATNPSDRHQEYKIRTVKSLAQAYQQQQQIHQQFQQQIMNRNQTTKANHSNNAASGNKFMQGNGAQPVQQHTIYTQYEKHRNSLGIAQQTTGAQRFNGNNTQEMNYQDGMPEIIDNTRNRSPLLGQHSGKFVQYANQNQVQQQYQQQRQHTQDDRYGQYNNNQQPQKNGNPDNFPKDLFTREKSMPPMVTQPHVTLRKKDTDTQSSFNPRSTNKYSSSHKKASNRSGTITQNSHRDRMNVSADYIHNSNHSTNLNDPYSQNKNQYNHHTNESDEEGEEEGQQQQYYDEEDDDDDENQSEDTNPNSDAYEALRIQQIKDLQRQQQQQRLGYSEQKRVESGIGHLDVSLPVIRTNNQQ